MLGVTLYQLLLTRTEWQVRCLGIFNSFTLHILETWRPGNVGGSLALIRHKALGGTPPTLN